MSAQKKILHVVGGMNRAGTETWLMNILRRIDRSEYLMDFLVHSKGDFHYSKEIISLGSRLLVCPYPDNPVRYAFSFINLISEFGPYNVVHSHIHHYSGYIMMLSKFMGVPIRIVHSHSNTQIIQRENKLIKKVYIAIMESMINKFATKGLAVSELAAISLFGPQWKSDQRWKVSHCCIDIKPFMRNVDKHAIKNELGLPVDSLVIGHVGRFSEPKNHEFILEVFNRVLDQKDNAWLLLVGDGPLRSKIEMKAELLGIKEKIIFAGIRNDIAELMMSVMDAFVFPSKYEGLPLVLMEAQAAGLPSIISDNISNEAIILKKFVTQLPLKENANEWAMELLKIAKMNRNMTCWEGLAGGDFDLDEGVKRLLHNYR